MPYFLYRITPERKLSLIDTFEKYRDASSTARRLRAEQNVDDRHQIRMIFADTPKQAQLLLTDLRKPKTEGDD